MLVSALDVRVYELAGTATAQGLKAALEFESHARQPVVQELPIVNGSAQDWSVQAMLKAEDFSGPPSLKVPANSTAYYPLEFCPSWVCERTGELVLTNQTTGDKYSFSLKGAGEEPLAEAHHVLEGQARKPQSLSLTVFNVAADGQPCELTVDSDLMHLSGAPTVAVGARAKNAGGARARAAWSTSSPSRRRCRAPCRARSASPRPTAATCGTRSSCARRRPRRSAHSTSSRRCARWSRWRSPS